MLSKGENLFFIFPFHSKLVQIKHKKREKKKKEKNSPEANFPQHAGLIFSQSKVSTELNPCCPVCLGVC